MSDNTSLFLDVTVEEAASEIAALPEDRYQALKAEVEAAHAFDSKSLLAALASKLGTSADHAAVLLELASMLRAQTLLQGDPQPEVIEGFVTRFDRVLDPAARNILIGRLTELASPAELVSIDTDFIDTEFLPSVALTGFWIRGLQRRLKISDMNEEELGFDLSAQSPDARQEFGLLVSRIIAVMGYRQQHGIGEFSEFGRNGRFDVAVTDLMLDQIPILGDEATAFFRMLYRELLAYLQRSPIQGDWGSLNASQADINLIPGPIEVE
jgi:hypothetical protein